MQSRTACGVASVVSANATRVCTGTLVTAMLLHQDAGAPRVGCTGTLVTGMWLHQGSGAFRGGWIPGRVDFTAVSIRARCRRLYPAAFVVECDLLAATVAGCPWFGLCLFGR